MFRKSSSEQVKKKQQLLPDIFSAKGTDTHTHTWARVEEREIIIELNTHSN